MTKILIGPAGSKGNTLEGVKWVAENNLDSLEVEYTYGVNMSNSKAKEIGELAKKLNVKLSVHAPYYINLASKEKAKRSASKKRILDSCERAHYLGASNVVFHAAFYQGLDEEEVYRIVKEAITEIQAVITKNKWNVTLCPEVTGKKTQFGGLDILLRLKKVTGCGICVDFAHMKARENGNVDFGEEIKKLDGLDLHAHYSGINFGEKGEKNHIPIDEKEWKSLVDLIKKSKIKSINFICEAPDIYSDALKMKKISEKFS
jgi:deoxyribonuclease-4